MKYKHIKKLLMPFIVLKKLELISNLTLGQFIRLFHKMTHNNR